MTYRALCQDCLRAPTFSTLENQRNAHEGVIRCECGGDLCICGACLDIVKDLEATGNSINLNNEAAMNWTAAGGVVL